MGFDFYSLMLSNNAVARLLLPLSVENEKDMPSIKVVGAYSPEPNLWSGVYKIPGGE